MNEDLKVRLKKLDTDKLMDVMKNYRQYNYEENVRNEAIQFLAERGISVEDLRLTGNLGNTNYNRADEVYQEFNRNSKIAFILYGLTILTAILLRTMQSEDSASYVYLAIFEILLFLSFLGFMISSLINRNRFYKLIGLEDGAEGAILYLFIGMPFYIILFFYLRKEMKEKMKTIPS
jgi:hypothetical protein